MNEKEIEITGELRNYAKEVKHLVKELDLINLYQANPSIIEHCTITVSSTNEKFKIAVVAMTDSKIILHTFRDKKATA